MTQSNRFLPYTRWPEELAELYRAKGYWRGEPLTAMLARQRELAPYAEAILCGERRFSYRELDAASSRLATFTVSPSVANSSRRSEPILPMMAGPK